MDCAMQWTRACENNLPIIKMPDDSTGLDDLSFAFLDVETTGLSPRYGDRVCEIAVVRSRVDLVQATFQSLVNPERSISPGAAAVNGLSDDDVRDAPRFRDIADTLIATMRDTVLVCHNAPFDLGFVTSEMQRAGRTFAAPLVVDTLAIARHSYRFRSNSLSNIARVLNIPTPDAHRALGDAMTTRAVLTQFIEDLWKRGARTLGDLIIAQGEPAIVPAVDSEPLPPEIAEALSAGKRLFLEYVDVSGEKSERWVTPQKIVGVDDMVALLAYCHLREAQRQFRLDRIVRMEVEET
jgi:DNA polymerase III subunit epsilon